MGLAVTVPSLPAKQLTFICAVKFIVNGAGSAIIALVVAVHPLASVIVKVYVPLDRLLMLMVVNAPGCHK